MYATRILGCTALVAIGVIYAATSALAAADTLVVRDGDEYVAGAASSWEVGENVVVFELAEDADGAAIAQLLSERLANATVSFAEGKLEVKGVPTAALLDQLATLSLSGKGDPLAELAGLGGAVIAMNAPEGGGSIRASKPAPGATKPRSIAEHDANERLTAEVLTVERGPFPHVKLELKVRRSAKAGPYRKQLRRGKVLQAVVVYATTEEGVDLRESVNQQNLAGYYLEKGDRVQIHPVLVGEQTVEVDWVGRVAR